MGLDTGSLDGWSFVERVRGNTKTRKERYIEAVKSLANKLNKRLRADRGRCHNKATEAFQWRSMTLCKQTSTSS